MSSASFFSSRSMKIGFLLFFYWLAWSGLFPAMAQPSDRIRLNQVGFYPHQPKVAVVKDAGPGAFYLIDPTGSDTLFVGNLSTPQTWSYSQEKVSRADFSAWSKPGRYVLAVPGVGTSFPFDITARVHQSVAQMAMKSFYFQRASVELTKPYAGIWARPAGHPDTAVLIHPSAASVQRPANSRISSAKGWYDAGDYNKYIVNSGITTYTLLAAFERFSAYCAAGELDLPESTNWIPDLLDEILWNLRWMLTMQDPNDGGVYHKLTNANFDGWVMPHRATTARYVVKKTTTASLDFAAVMAQASRVFAGFSASLPGLADSCLQASLTAWRWARANPSTFYNQTQINQQFDPDINTGEYGDGYAGDEFDWAAAELCITTRQDSFLSVGHPLNAAATVPSWPNVRTLGLFSLSHHRQAIGHMVDTTLVKSRLVTLANSLRSSMTSSAYGVVMGNQKGDFVWGSNGVAANQGMTLLCAFELTRDSTYLPPALANLDYLLGRNAAGYCFVTGIGSRSPLHPHHRPSQADNVPAPIPGLLAGGPNPNREDGLTTYPSSLPGLAYVDSFESYASNENAINWNAPLVFLAIGLEALLSPDGLPSRVDAQGSSLMPRRTRLGQNYPNPFNPITHIPYWLEKPSFVSLEIYDLLGRRQSVLVEQKQTAGEHIAVFDGSQLPTALYFYRLVVDGSISSGSMTLLK